MPTPDRIFRRENKTGMNTVNDQSIFRETLSLERSNVDLSLPLNLYSIEQLVMELKKKPESICHLRDPRAITGIH